jgi:hypothetical protein
MPGVEATAYPPSDGTCTQQTSALLKASSSDEPEAGNTTHPNGVFPSATTNSHAFLGFKQGVIPCVVRGRGHGHRARDGFPFPVQAKTVSVLVVDASKML